MYYLCSENKGADQLCGYAKLICAFVFAYAKSRFSHDAAHTIAMDGITSVHKNTKTSIELKYDTLSSLTKMKRLLQGCSSVAATMQQSNMYATTGGDKVAN